MKDIIIIIAAAALVGTAIFYEKVLDNLSESHLARVTELKQEIDLLEEELASAASAASEASASSTLLHDTPEPISSETSVSLYNTPDPKAQAQAPAGMTYEELQARQLANDQRLEGILSGIETKEVATRAEIERGRNAYRQASSSSGNFREYNTVTRADGTSYTTGGIRTSDADRKKFEDQKRASLAAIQAKLDALELELSKLEIARRDAQAAHRLANQKLDLEYRTLNSK